MLSWRPGLKPKLWNTRRLRRCLGQLHYAQRSAAGLTKSETRNSTHRTALCAGACRSQWASAAATPFRVSATAVVSDGKVVVSVRRVGRRALCRSVVVVAKRVCCLVSFWVVGNQFASLIIIVFFIIKFLKYLLFCCFAFRIATHCIS